MHERENALKEWLFSIIKHNDFILSPLYGDASFRRYFRLEYNGLTQIVMDAPPEKERTAPFVHIAHRLAREGLLVPEIIAQEEQQGFLVLTDFGDDLLLGALRPETVDYHYNQAIDTLFQIQECSIDDPRLAVFDKNFMIKEMNLCSDWFLKAYLSLDLDENEQQLIRETTEWVATQVAQEPLVFIHRDYHSRNLILVGPNSLGVIDFQDAMRGPLTYDLVSLLKDCYIEWPREKVLKWVEVFHSRSPYAGAYTLNEFIRAFDLCGFQRHMKVLGVFCRLSLRDNKSGYIKDLPLTLKYLLECAEIYKELLPFYDLLQKRVYLP